ncbi:MAG: hypothetical protein ACF8R7_15455 [Phycisphaerales bacterium JB039]
MSMRAIAACLALAAASTCAAQETILFRIPRASTPAEPRLRIELWARFSPADYAFASARFEFSAGDGIFSDTYCVVGTSGCGGGPVHDGSRVYLVLPGQLHFPPGGIYADPANPIAIVETFWRPESLDVRDVPIDTLTGDFSVYLDPELTLSASRISTFIEGAAIIRVRRCYADCDGTDDLDLFDFLCFQNAFATDDYYADCDASGALDFFDFLCFQNEFATGCG